MAITKRAETAAPPSAKKPALVIRKGVVRHEAAALGLALPTALNVPSEIMGDYTWLIYGAKKIGKSSLAAQFPDALFMMFEPGGKALRTYQADCKTWKHALEYLALLEKQKPLKYKTLVVDTGFEAYQKCFVYICDELNIEYPREDNFGKDWRKIENEFRSFHNRIAALGLGLVVLCHENLKESMTRTGNKFDMVVPNLPKAADSYYRAVIDNVCWYHYRSSERFLLVKGSDYAMAGTAVQADERFLTKTREAIHAIPMGNSAVESFEYLSRAFRNEQTATYQAETQKFTEDAIRTSVHANLKKRK